MYVWGGDITGGKGALHTPSELHALHEILWLLSKILYLAYFFYAACMHYA